MELLTTGDVARMLGTSRQHVVDLCESGRLPCVRVGTHRRIDRLDVEAMLTGPPPGVGLRPEQLTSLWLHHAVAGELVKDPAKVLDKARTNLDMLTGQHPEAQRWLDGWRRVLDRDPQSVLQVLTSLDPSAVELRQNSPFAGTITQAARSRVLASARQQSAAQSGA